MTTEREQLATVLEKIADYIDEHEGARIREKIAETTARVSGTIQEIEDASGVPIPADLREKMASFDPSVLEHFARIAKSNGGSPDSLGGPADDNDTTKTAGYGDPILNFVMG